MLSLLILLLCYALDRTAASCVVTHYGLENDIVLKGTVLAPSGPLADGYIHVYNGRIASVGERYSKAAAYSWRATIIDCGNSIITPGFINTHEHIEYSLTGPFIDTGERYETRNEWRKGLNDKTQMEPEVIPGMEPTASVWGELRHLFSGTTSMLGGGYAPGLVRNLDRHNGLGRDLQGQAGTLKTFPLDDSSGMLCHGNCDYGSNAVTQRDTDGRSRYVAHIGEGVGAYAQNEFQCISSRNFDTTARDDGSGVSVDIVGPNLVLVQANSLTDKDFDLIAERKAMVVWSPRSNVALYGSTLNVTYLLEAGITVALGTDWLFSGSATMSREAHCAAAAMRWEYKIPIDARSLWQMMTINAAKIAGFEDHIGSLEVGMLADIIIWSGDSKPDVYAQAIFTPPEGLEMVMRGGEILLTSSTLHLKSRADNCESVMFGAVEKFVCVRGELNTTFVQFQSVLGAQYPAVLPGVPPDEPSCEIFYR